MTSDAAAVAAATGDDPVVTVALQRYPLRLGLRATEHYSEVFREFALLAADGRATGDDVPARLLALVDALGRRYPSQQTHERQRDAALARGHVEADLYVDVPASAAEAGLALGTMLDETDAFCRDGTLLTLAAADDVTAFRRWYIGEIVAQVAGRAPTPWSGGWE